MPTPDYAAICDFLLRRCEDKKLLEVFHRSSALGIGRLNAEEGLRTGMCSIEVYEHGRKFQPHERPAHEVLGRKPRGTDRLTLKKKGNP